MTIYVMDQALVCDWNTESVVPNVDQYSYRNVETTHNTLYWRLYQTQKDKKDTVLFLI